MADVIDLDAVRLASLLNRIEDALPADVFADPLLMSALLVLLGKLARDAGMSMAELFEHCRGVFGPGDT